MPDAEQALVRAYVACRLALESISDLPAETADAVAEPIRTFCRALEPYVGHLADRDSRRKEAI
ncbi:MAG TPA: hypothetical protein VJV76_00895 [Gaiellaceae bacterium]|nr:hypothetical protein [Gaiellaceae bacterium]